MSDAQASSTHPVYIDKDLKQEVKHEATDQETTMKIVTERLIRHGMREGFHEKPLEKEKSEGEDEDSESENESESESENESDGDQ